jgi:hypothetical protein
VSNCTTRPLAVTGPAEQLTGSCDSGMLSNVTNVVQPSPSVKGSINSIQSGSRVTVRRVRITTVVGKTLLNRSTDSKKKKKKLKQSRYRPGVAQRVPGS